jgi:RNA polymerase sigma-B factor
MTPSQAHSLIEELRSPQTSTLRSEEIREQIIREHQGLVRHFIHVHDQDLREELIQLGNIGLLQAIDKFDLSRDTAFSTYAGTHIRGEISHYLRDNYKAIRIPRNIQENSRKINAAIENLTIALERSPTVREISEASGIDSASILEALESVGAMDMRTLSEPESWDWAPTEDHGFESTEAWLTIAPALDLLSDSDRKLLGLRFMQGLSQSEIARLTGMHQVAVGRRITQILTDLRRDTGEL